MDSALWLRHFLGLVVQTAAASYITLLSWDGTLLSFLTIPMLLCGIIKYGERTWVLMSADRKNLQDSFQRVNYARFMEEFSLKEAELLLHPLYIRDASILQTANYFFKTLEFKRIFVDLVLSFRVRVVSQSFFKRQDYKTAFQVIECELGFAYDVLYTKTPIIYTPFGVFSRLFTSFVTLSVLVTFLISIGLRSHKHVLIDVVVTCILLIGAILLELYAAISSLSSDWANLWFSQHASKVPLLSHLVLPILSTQKGKRWSNSMHQFSLLDFSLNQKSSTFQEILGFIPIGKSLKKNLCEKWQSFCQLKHLDVSPELKSFILDYFTETSTDTLDLNMVFTCRGAVSLQAHESYGTFKWTDDA
ncbi:hypothetical protein L6452_13958 [Arctium lappa]|uniref:Uncharacterized protein n=1 Tax=Arctium lappa TaxID=4217 RepID=A0ACB9CJR8_ARCLA|nr:hypothetical protein L6452_13958 [Arctium lappa]